MSPDRPETKIQSDLFPIIPLLRKRGGVNIWALFNPPKTILKLITGLRIPFTRHRHEFFLH